MTALFAARRLRIATIVAAALVLLSAVPPVARAQTASGPPQRLPVSDVRPGDPVWVTTSDGREHEGRLAEMTTAALRLTMPAGERRWGWDEVALVEARVSDPVSDGVRKGALTGGLAMAGFSGVVVSLVCLLGDCGWTAARVTLVLTGIGAGTGALVGAAVDGAHRTRSVVHPAGVGPLRHGLRLGETVWITASDGRDVQGRVLSASASVLDLAAGGARVTLSMDDLRSIEARRRDGVADGVGKGALAGAAAMAGLLVVGQALGGDCCEGLLTLYWSAVGAGGGALAGAGLDGLHHARTVVYPAGSSNTRAISIVPIAGRDRRGIALSIRW